MRGNNLLPLTGLQVHPKQLAAVSLQVLTALFYGIAEIPSRLVAGNFHMTFCLFDLTVVLLTLPLLLKAAQHLFALCAYYLSILPVGI